MSNFFPLNLHEWISSFASSGHDCNFLIIAWFIQCSRNHYTLSSDAWTPIDIFGRIVHLEDVCNMVLSKSSTVERQTTLVHRNPPTLEFVKINVDGSFR